LPFFQFLYTSKWIVAVHCWVEFNCAVQSPDGGTVGAARCALPALFIVLHFGHLLSVSLLFACTFARCRH